MGRFKKPEPITSDHSTAQVNNQRLGWGGKKERKSTWHKPSRPLTAGCENLYKVSAPLDVNSSRVQEDPPCLFHPK